MNENVAYLRYSDHKQDDGFSIEYQTHEIEAFAAHHGIEIYRLFVDKAQTGTKVAGREEFFSLINDVKSDKIKTIIVYKLSRMFRNTYESSKYRELFRQKGVRLMSVTQSVDEDTSSGRLQTNILSSIDQYQSETISDHVKSSMREMARQGFYTGGTVKYGYALKEVPNGKKARKIYIPHPTEAPIIKRIFEMYASGMSFPAIRNVLNNERIKTKKGGLWTCSFLQKVIKNDMYMGVYRFKTKGYDEIVIEDKIPALVDKALWITANDVKDKKSTQRSPQPRQRKSIYALTGKIVCAKCGAYHTGNVHHAYFKNTKKTYRYYGCVNNRRHNTCDAKMFRKDLLENATLEAIKRHILNEEKIKEIAEMVIHLLSSSPSDFDNKIKSKKSAKKQAEIKIQNLLEALASGKSDYALRMVSDLEEDIKKIDKEIYVLTERKKSELTIESIIDYMEKMLAKCNSANEEEIKTIFDCFVNKIVISDESAVITLNAFAGVPNDMPSKDIDCKIYKS